jgi:hypothetical protein
LMANWRISEIVTGSINFIGLVEESK